MREWPGSSPCRSQGAQYGVTSWFQEPYQVCAYAYKSCLCRHQNLVIAGPVAGVRSFHLQCLLSTLFQFRPPWATLPTAHGRLDLEKANRRCVSLWNNGSSNRFKCYRPTRISGDQPLGTVQTRDMDQHSYSIHNNGHTHNSLFSTISTNSPA